MVAFCKLCSILFNGFIHATKYLLGGSSMFFACWHRCRDILTFQIKDCHMWCPRLTFLKVDIHVFEIFGGCHPSWPLAFNWDVEGLQSRITRITCWPQAAYLYVVWGSREPFEDSDCHHQGFQFPQMLRSLQVGQVHPWHRAGRLIATALSRWFLVTSTGAFDSMESRSATVGTMPDDIHMISIWSPYDLHMISICYNWFVALICKNRSSWRNLGDSWRAHRMPPRIQVQSF